MEKELLRKAFYAGVNFANRSYPTLTFDEWYTENVELSEKDKSVHDFLEKLFVALNNECEITREEFNEALQSWVQRKEKDIQIASSDYLNS